MKRKGHIWKNEEKAERDRRSKGRGKIRGCRQGQERRQGAAGRRTASDTVTEAVV